MNLDECITPGNLSDNGPSGDMGDWILLSTNDEGSVVDIPAKWEFPSLEDAIPASLVDRELDLDRGLEDIFTILGDYPLASLTQHIDTPQLQHEFYGSQHTITGFEELLLIAIGGSEPPLEGPSNWLRSELATSVPMNDSYGWSPELDHLELLGSNIFHIIDEQKNVILRDTSQGKTIGIESSDISGDTVEGSIKAFFKQRCPKPKLGEIPLRLPVDDKFQNIDISLPREGVK